MLCLSLFQLLQQNTADRGACKQQRFVALGSGGRKSEIRVLAGWMRALFRAAGFSSALPWKKGVIALGLFPDSTNSVQGGSTFTTGSPPEGPAPSFHHSQVRLSAGGSGRGHARADSSGLGQGSVSGNRAGCAECAQRCRALAPTASLAGRVCFVGRLSGKE